MENLSTAIDSDGYLLPSGHFEIGKNLHIENYYYSKKYFQSVLNSETVGKELAEQIFEAIPDLRNTTLVGYGNYSGLFLSATVNELKHRRKEIGNLNYALIGKEDEDFAFSFDPNLNRRLIVVLPITCTFERYFFIRRFLAAKYPDKIISSEFFAVFLIADEVVCKIIDELPIVNVETIKPRNFFINNIKELDIRELYSTYNWSSIRKRKVQFSTGYLDFEKDNEAFVGHFLRHYRSHLHLPMHCKLCFPTKVSMLGNELTLYDEVPLLKSMLNSETINTVLDLPKLGNDTLGDNNPGRNFQDVFYPIQNKPIHLYGHLRIRNNSYLNFIQRDIFYRKNKDVIINYFFTKLIFLRCCQSEDKIVIISAGHFHTSGFLEDLIDKNTFGDADVSIIQLPPFSEHLENFIVHNATLIKEAYTILYFDDVIAGGQTFKLISDYLKNARMQFKSDGEPIDKGFDYVLTLIDRTTKFVKQEILRKLVSGIDSLPNQFISFFKLNVPQIDSNQVDNPITERAITLRALFNSSQLDGLKLFLGKEISKNAPKRLEDLKDDYESRRVLKFFPFIEKERQFVFYDSIYNYELRNLIKLYLFHDISTILMGVKKFDRNIFDQIFEQLTNINKLNQYFNLSTDLVSSPDRAIPVESEIISENILKILSRPPFRNHRDIYEVTFHYNIEKLKDISESVAELAGNFLNERRKLNFDKIHFNSFRRLRMHIKRSVELDSNFILSEYFLLKIKQLFVDEAVVIRLYDVQRISNEKKNIDFYRRKNQNLPFQRNEIVKFKFFLLASYKELIHKNPARAIVLEQLLNSSSLMPDGFIAASEQNNIDSSNDKYQLSLKDIISNTYYQVRRILQSENTYFLSKLKDHELNSGLVAKALLRGSAEIDRPKYRDTQAVIETINALLASFNRINDSLFLREKEECVNQFKEDRNFVQIINECMSDCLDGLLRLEVVKEQLIRRYFFNKYFKSNKASLEISGQTNLFLSQSKNAEAIKDSVCRMLYASTLLKSSGKMNSDKSGGQGKNGHFLREIKKILNAVSKILGDDLTSGIFIEFRERRAGERDSANIFSVISDSDETITLSSDGLIYNMLYGLEDYIHGNLQTFTATARTDGDEIISFKDDYYTLSLEREETPAEDDTATQNNISDSCRVNVKKALAIDSSPKEGESDLIKNANMMLLFRLANVEKDHTEKHYVSSGQAVLAICSKSKSTLKSFSEFVNMERLRLLLLLKDQLLSYLKKQFDSDAFISVLEEKRVLEYRQKLSHGINSYFLALNFIKSEIKEGKDLYENSILSNVLIDAVAGQIDAGLKANFEFVSVSGEELKSNLKLLFKTPFLGNQEMFFENFEIPDKLPGLYYQGIFKVIIPELIINMKKYSPRTGDPELSIRYIDNKITFRNKISDIIQKSEKHVGGLAMCNEMLSKLGINKIQPSSTQQKNGYYEITLNLLANR